MSDHNQGVFSRLNYEECLWNVILTVQIDLTITVRKITQLIDYRFCSRNQQWRRYLNLVILLQVTINNVGGGFLN